MGTDKPNQSSTATDPNSGVVNNVANAGNEESKALFKSNALYQGVIESVNHGDGEYNVSLVGNDSTAQACGWGVGIINNAFLGYKTSWKPTVGTGVYVLGGNSPVIIGTYPNSQRDDNSGENATSTSTGVDVSAMNSGTSGEGKNHTMASDQLEGEFAIENGLGPAIQFLTNLISIKGSDRAKVETHLLNDMVRIVSDTYKHFSAFGDYQIYNDGGLNCVFEGTSREHEAQGLATDASEKVNVTSNEVNFESGLSDSARWRFSQYMGFLGDFIHVFVTDPSTTLSNIGEGMRAGKSRFWQGSDGTCLLQSVTEIALERVVRIPVPMEKKRWDDPTGVLKTAWNEMIKNQDEFTKIWNYGTDYRNIHEAAFQLREYARWLGCFHSYARFHQYDEEAGEWVIPDEDAISHEWTNKEGDVEGVNTHISGTYDTYACIRIMRDGAIVLWDGYGSAVTMSRRNIDISAPRHINLTAGGDISLVAGGDLFLKARRHIEIIASVGSIISKSRTAWKALCEYGTMWLKSDAKDPQDPNYVADVPDDADEDPVPEVHDAAILIEGLDGRMTLNSGRTLTVQVDSNSDADDDEDHSDISKSVIIQSRMQDVKILGQRDINLKSLGSNDGYISLDSSNAIVGTSNKFLLDCSIFDIGQKFTISGFGAVVNAGIVKTESVASQGPLFGGETLQWVDPDGEGYVNHTNHVLVSKSSQAPEFASDITPMDNYKSIKNDLRYIEPFEERPGPLWMFYTEGSDYGWDYTSTFPVEESDREYPYVPLAQQRIDFDDDLTSQYGEWDMTSDALKESYRTRSGDVPYPGSASKELYHPSSKSPLHKVFDEPYKSQDPSIQTKMKRRSVTRQYLKPSNNKTN